MAKKSKAAKPPLKQAECAPLLGTYTSSTNGTFVAAWQDGGFRLYRTPLTGPGQSSHLNCAHEFRRLLSFAVFTRAAEQVQLPDAAPALPPAPREFLSDFTVIDTEFQESSLLEVAAVRYQNWQPVAKMISFVRFTGEVNYHVSKLTGITANDVRTAPTEMEVMRELRQLIGDSLLIAHNISADRRLIEATRTRLGAAEPLPNAWLCTMALARLRYPAPHKLSDLCHRFGIPTTGAHRAMKDVEMCYRLLQRMHQEQPITGELPTKRKPARAQPSLFATAA